MGLQVATTPDEVVYKATAAYGVDPVYSSVTTKLTHVAVMKVMNMCAEICDTNGDTKSAEEIRAKMANESADKNCMRMRVSWKGMHPREI